MPIDRGITAMYWGRVGARDLAVIPVHNVNPQRRRPGGVKDEGRAKASQHETGDDQLAATRFKAQGKSYDRGTRDGDGRCDERERLHAARG